MEYGNLDFSRRYSFNEKLKEQNLDFDSEISEMEGQEDSSLAVKLLLYMDATLQGKLDLSAYFELAEKRIESLNRFGLDVDHQILSARGELKNELMTTTEKAKGELQLISRNSNFLDALFEDIGLRKNMSLSLNDTMDLIRLEELAQDGEYENEQLSGEKFGRFRVDWLVIKRAIFKHF